MMARSAGTKANLYFKFLKLRAGSKLPAFFSQKQRWYLQVTTLENYKNMSNA
jgi:hypothetical protein